MEVVEYRVRPVTRYIVTRYHNEVGDDGADCRLLGEYDNESVAHEVAYALCREEHSRLGWPVGDERIKYPTPMVDASRTKHPPPPPPPDERGTSFKDGWP